MSRIFSVLLFFGLPLLSVTAQDADSIVTYKSEDFNSEGERLENYIETYYYKNGVEIEMRGVEYYGNAWEDSTTIITTLDDDGKPLKRVKTVVFNEECYYPPVDSRDLIITLPFIGDSSTAPEPRETYCPRIAQITHYYSDSMEVMHGLYDIDSPESKSIDTTFLDAFGRVTKKVEYRWGRLSRRQDYEYKVDDVGSVIETKSIYYNGREKSISIYKHKYINGKKVDYEIQSFIDNDTNHVNFRRIEYNEDARQIRYTNWVNGELISFAKNTFKRDDLMDERTHYYADSSIKSHSTYNWQFSEDFSERWSHQDYKDGEPMERYGYYRVDTVLYDDGYEVRRYGYSKNQKKLSKGKRPRLVVCKPSQFVRFDSEGRRIWVQNFDFDEAWVSMRLSWSYSH